MDYLTPIQRECLERKGDCAGCIHGLVMESAVCQVRHSDGVAQVLGLKVKGPRYQLDYIKHLADEAKRRERKRQARQQALRRVCPICSQEFEGYNGRARYCQDCKATGLSLRACKYCGERVATRSGSDVSCKPCQDKIIAAGGAKAARVLAGRAKAENERKRKESA